MKIKVRISEPNLSSTILSFYSNIVKVPLKCRDVPFAILCDMIECAECVLQIIQTVLVTFFKNVISLDTSARAACILIVLMVFRIITEIL